MDRIKIVFNEVPLFSATKLKELVSIGNFECKVDGNSYELKGEVGSFSGLIFTLVHQALFTLNVSEFLYFDEASPNRPQDLKAAFKEEGEWHEDENVYTWLK